MKINTLLIVVFIGLTSCSSVKKQLSQKEIKSIKNNVNILLNNWHKAAADANYNNYFKAMDTSSVFIGTDPSENWSKKAFQKYSKPYFDKGKAWSFTVLERNVFINNKSNFIWFDELLNTQMGICRGSGVIENTTTGLKIKHYVLSITIPNDNVKTIVNINKEKNNLFLQKFNH